MAGACILGAITAASFLVWAVPQGRDATFVVTDFGAHLDGVRGIHGAVTGDLDDALEGLRAGTVSPDEYVRMAEASAAQINAQIVSVIESDPPEEWQESYAAYLESLRQSGAYVRETIVAANMARDGAGAGAFEGALEQAGRLRDAAEGLAAESDGARP